MKITTETITPEKATRWLTSNTNNRRIRLRYVDTLAKELIEGRWVMNGDPIRFNGDILIDGQHRLMAIEKAGISIQAVVIRGLGDDAFRTIDTGKTRTAGDCFKLSGEINYCLLASAVATYHKYTTGTMRAGGGTPITVCSEVLQKNPKIRDSVNTYHHRLSGLRIAPASVACCCHYIFSLLDREQADSVLESLIEGAPSHISVLHGMRQWMIRKRADNKSGMRVERFVYMAAMIKTWNALRENRTIAQFGLRDGEDFPVAK